MSVDIDNAINETLKYLNNPGLNDTGIIQKLVEDGLYESDAFLILMAAKAIAEFKLNLKQGGINA